MKSDPKISIITIVYNDVRHVENTIRSIISQRYKNIEYVVIDGNSTDGTLEILQKYTPDIDQLISEPDNGIYDAMNKGLQLASGEYVLFLNSGDKLYNTEILQSIVTKLKGNLPDVIYGETMIIDENGDEIGLRRLRAPKELTWKNLKDGMLVCHQSFMVKREIAPQYDLKYKLASDYHWMLGILKVSNEIWNSHTIISSFLDGGTSKNNIRNSLKERFDIMIKNYGLIPTVLNHILIGVRFSYFYIRNRRF